MPGLTPAKLGLTARRKVSAFLLGVFLSLQVLAAVPFLHALVHADCNDPTHECGVTLFSHGQVDSCDTAVFVVPIAPVPFVQEPAPCSVLFALDTPLLPGRGPPVLS